MGNLPGKDAIPPPPHPQTRDRNLSVILPALNEEKNIAASLQSVKLGAVIRRPEVIVVDGGSTDRTRDVAAAHGARVIQAERGRGLQLRTGAEAASGDVLLFLHSDSKLPERYDESILSSVAASKRPEATWGSFRDLAIEAPGPLFRLVEFMVRVRTEVFRLPYGDQAIFAHRKLYDKVGGVPAIPLMEDVELVSKMKRVEGNCPVFLPGPLATSARRWQRLGVLKTTAINQATMAAYVLGVPPERLAEFYYRAKKETKKA